MKNVFPILNGKVVARSLETHIVDHCNLRCASCCSLSPHLPKWEMEPAMLAEDLRLARTALSPTWLKLVGGEPLLHSRLIECLQIAKAAAVAPIVSLTTNGWLLPRQPDELWKLLDAMTISLYPQPSLPEKIIALAEQKAAQFQVKLNWKRQDCFVQMDRATECSDASVNEAVWEACWLRRRCHMIREGVFYACTRPAHFGTLLGRNFTKDGVRLHEGPELALEIKRYLERNEPLAACALCFGGDAADAPHRMLAAGEGRVLVTA